MTVVAETQNITCPHHERHEKNFSGIWKILNGNGTPGTVEKARVAYEYALSNQQSKNGFYDWLFRSVIFLLLSYIAVRIGLK